MRSRTLFTLVATLCAVVAGIQPARADGLPHLLRDMPYYLSAGVATNRLTHTTYVADFQHDRVMIYDDTTGAVRFKAITGCYCVAELVSDDATGKLFITPGGEENGLYMLDERTLQVTRLSEDGLWSLAVDQRRNVVYAGDWSRPVIHVIDGRTGRYTGAIQHGFAFNLVVDPARDRLFIWDQNMGDAVIKGSTGDGLDLFVLDLATGRRIANLPHDMWTVDVEDASGLIYAPEGRSITVLDARTIQPVRRIPVPANVEAGNVALDPATGRLFVTGHTACPLNCPYYGLAVDAASGALLWKMRLGGFGGVTSVDPDRRLVFLTTGYHLDVVTG